MGSFISILFGFKPKYNLDNLLYDYQYSSIYISKRKEEIIMLKKLNYKNYKRARKELLITKKNKHFNLVSCSETFKYKGFTYLVMNFTGEYNLSHFLIEKNSCMNEERSNIIFRQLLSALDYLHTILHICHGDIKAENILICNVNTFQIKLIEFGFSRLIEKKKKYKAFIGDIKYASPESINLNYDYRCDIWSLGVVLYLCLCLKFPFNGDDYNNISYNIINKKISFSEIPLKISFISIDLLSRLLKKNPKRRITIDRCFQHKWVLKNF